MCIVFGGMKSNLLRLPSNKIRMENDFHKKYFHFGKEERMGKDGMEKEASY